MTAGEIEITGAGPHDGMRLHVPSEVVTTARYDGPCFTCDGWISVGDHIGRTTEGGWTCERCLP